MKLPEDPMIRELFPEFIETWLVDISEQFMPAYNSKNTQDIYRIGHTIKGTCLQFGVDEVAQLGISMMAASKEEDWKTIFELYMKIKKEFETAKKELDAMGIK